MSRFPQRPRSHELKTWAEKQFFPSLLPSAWSTINLLDDYGIDLTVEIFTQGSATGLCFAVQLKAATRLRHKRGHVPVRMRVSTLNYQLQYALPVLIVACDRQQETAYWIWAREYTEQQLEKTCPSWTRQKTITLRIPESQQFTAHGTPDQIREYLEHRDRSAGQGLLRLQELLLYLRDVEVDSQFVAKVENSIKDMEKLYMACYPSLARSGLLPEARRLSTSLSRIRASSSVTASWHIRGDK